MLSKTDTMDTVGIWACSGSSPNDCYRFLCRLVEEHQEVVHVRQTLTWMSGIRCTCNSSLVITRSHLEMDPGQDLLGTKYINSHLCQILCKREKTWVSRLRNPKFATKWQFSMYVAHKVACHQDTPKFCVCIISVIYLDIWMELWFSMNIV